MFSYLMTCPFNSVAGVVVADNKEDAERIIRETYCDCNSYKLKIEKIDLNENLPITEIYYG